LTGCRRAEVSFSSVEHLFDREGWEREMRRYDDPVEVRKGAEDDPEQFLWRGKLWKVRAVLAHWVETGSWWQSADARAVIGSDDTGDDSAGDRPSGADLLGERELWRVEAGDSGGGGVFDLSFDWSNGSWQLVGCVD
jgi:hypothetical protein